MAALHRTFALAQIKHRAVLVAQHLDFDVARVDDELLDEHTVIAEAGQALAPHAVEGLAHVGLAMREAHALAAAAGRGLHHHRIANAIGDLDGMFGVAYLADEAGDDTDLGLFGQFLRFDLVAHRCDRLGRGADEGDFVVAQQLGETLALGQEAVAGMHGLGAGLLAGLEDEVGLQITFAGRRRPKIDGLIGQPDMRRARVRVRINGDRGYAHLARGADNTAGDLAPIGDQDFLEHVPSIIPPRWRVRPELPGLPSRLLAWV